MEDVKIEILGAINWDDYKSNSLVILKAPKDVLLNQEPADQLSRYLADMKAKWNIDDTTALWVTCEDFEVAAFDEKDLFEEGWIKK